MPTCIRELACVGRRPGVLAPLSIVIAIVSASPAVAQEAIHFPTVFGWTLESVSAGVDYAPDYIGSNDYRPWFSGAVVLSHPDTGPVREAAPDDGISLELLNKGPLAAGVVGRWLSSRDNGDDLRGFEKIDGAVEAGVFANWWPADWLRLRAEARHGFGGHHSWVGDFGADVIVSTDPWLFTAGPRLAWGDAAFTRKYFEVTPSAASRSPLDIQPFSPSGASWSPGVVVSATYQVNPRWSIETDGTYQRVTGDAADSPIVASLGSRDQFSVGVSISYTFGH